ncbi:hypothetical protein RsS62_24170 [Rhizobium dioscoreae]|nr:hypothetical protein RsS62_24170 [Rhizobium dioscoreae]GLU83756.1 hypothetical protein Rhsp01_49320 [Rhizobium sp. NBRC 114257]
MRLRREMQNDRRAVTLQDFTHQLAITDVTLYGREARIGFDGVERAKITSVRQQIQIDDIVICFANEISTDC